MSETKFRPCRRSQLASLQKLVDQLYELDPGELPSRPVIRLTFEEFERKPDKGTIIVIEQDGEPIGYAILVFFWSNEFGGDVLEIDEMMVDAGHRRQGLGKQFFAWLENEFPNSVAFALQVSETNTAALALYASVGFQNSRNKYLVKLRSPHEAELSRQ